jgi:glycosyltransferase involved in cell wall biosynthesis
MRAIESALSQDYPPSEVIIVDDGSTDDTRSLVESCGEKVRYVYQPNGGVSAARNLGIREAKFEWIAFLDSDDYWLPEHLKRIVSAIHVTSGEAALYFANLRKPDADGGQGLWQYCGLVVDGDLEFRSDASEWALARIQPMMLQASVIRRKTYIEVGEFPLNLRTREDTLLFFKLGLQYPACAVSGYGTVMNSDDNVRLSRMYDSRSVVYCEASISLYRELVGSLTRIDPRRHHILVHFLADSYYAFGRVLLQRGSYWSAIRSLGMSCRVSPYVFAKQLFISVTRRVAAARAATRPSPTSLVERPRS